MEDREETLSRSRPVTMETTINHDHGCEKEIHQCLYFLSCLFGECSAWPR